MRLPYWGLGLYLVVNLFYIMPPGLPQPADALLVLIMMFGLLIWRHIPPIPSLYLVLALFCLWIYIVNMVWFGIFGDWEFLLSSSYYTYNAIVLVFVIVAGYRDWPRLCAAIRWACVAALFAQLIYLVLVPESTTRGGLRAVGSFHNPNQLAYWALLDMVLLVIAKDGKPLGWVDLAALAAGSYAVLISLSKGGMAAGIVLLALILAFQRVRIVPALAVPIVACGALSVSVLASGNALEQIGNPDIMQKLERRINVEQADDNIMSRGYGVILENPQHWAVGAGEGLFNPRFAPKPGEIHSSLGNIFFSYGIVGLSLFLCILWFAFARAPLATKAYLVPILMYSGVHMGLRSSEFWIFLALACLQSHRRIYYAAPSGSRYLPERDASARRGASGNAHT
jgi:hypothetical protein